jgi:hypothetical protein
MCHNNLAGSSCRWTNASLKLHVWKWSQMSLANFWELNVSMETGGFSETLASLYQSTCHTVRHKPTHLIQGVSQCSPLLQNIYNKKTIWPTWMELFTATRKWKKKFFFYKWRCSMCVHRVTWHTSIRNLSSCHTRVNMGSSIFFTAAMIRAFRSARSRGSDPLPTSHEMQLHSSHRLIRVIFQHTKQLLPLSVRFLTTHTRIA